MIKVDASVLLNGLIDTGQYIDTQFDFCMCNPPFYDEGEDRVGGDSRTGHRPIPHTLNTGNQSETRTPGGEVEFVKRIIEDSLILGNKIK